MPVSVLEGRYRVRVHYRAWADFRQKRPIKLVQGRPQCSYCWGAGTILDKAANNEGYIPIRCPRCIGTGFYVN